jgi:hypothetical protein
MAQPHGGPEIDLSAPVALQHLVTSYQINQAVCVATRLGVAELLTDGPKTADELAQATGTHAPSLFRLLRALAAFAVLDEVVPGQFALTPVGACLQADAPNSLRDAVLMWGSAHFWQTAADLLHCVQTGESATAHLFGTANPFEYYRAHPDVGAMMHAGWAALGRIRAQAVVAVYDFPASGTLVDVGGNRGQLLVPILQAYPALRGVLFDLPHVVEEAAPFLQRAGVADRCTLIGGDMFVDVPAGGDTYLLSSVIHDWEDAEAQAILQSCRQAMAPQATLLLVERVLPTPLDHTLAAQEAATTDLTMLLRTGGRERTDAEYAALLTQASFALERIIPTQTGYSVVQSTAVSHWSEPEASVPG